MEPKDMGLGRARGRGRLYSHPPPHHADDGHPGPQRVPWSLTTGGPRPPAPPPGRVMLGMGRGSGIGVGLPIGIISSEDSTSGAGRGVKLSSDESAPKKPVVYPPARPDNKRGALRLKPEKPAVPERLLYTRPEKIVSKVGTTGQPITLTANYFRLARMPHWHIYQYRVDFKPDVVSDQLRKYLIFTQKEHLGGYLFDGTQLFVTKKLEGGDLIEKTAKGRIEEQLYTIIFKYTTQVSMDESTSLQILNLILRRSMDGLHLKLVGRNFFDPDAKTSMPEFKLEIWPGYITSIRQHEEDILVCAEISHKVMRKETVYSIMNRIRNEERDFKKKLMEVLLGTTVLTEYNNKTYRIDDINFEMRASSTFETKEGPITFVKYYKQRYNLDVKDPEQPLLVSKAKLKDLRGGQSDTILLVPELCRATGITDEMRANFKTMKAMSEHTRLAPKGRIQKLINFNKRLATTPQSQNVLTEWNLSLDPELVKIPGRILPFENIVFGNGKKVKTNERVDWTAEFRNSSMFHMVPLKRWYVITTGRTLREIQEFVSQLIIAARGMRFEVGDPRYKEIPDDRQLTFSNALEECAKDNPQMIMCVVSNNNADRYANIKKKCCIERPVPSQVICQRTITPKGGNPRGLLSIATKVAIQMNCKLGGLAWMIDMPISGLMTIGYDVCHDAKDKKKSYGAMVATMDLKKTHEFFSAVSPHTSGEELSNQITMDITKALQQFQELHGTLPARICIFRDGVGEGQVQYVAEHEKNAVKAKLDEIYKRAGVEEEVKFLFIIVSKRINTRIFFDDGNPKPGTVVDDIITLPERYDFFLISQSVRDGTVSPTSYNVIYDTFGVPPDRVQMLTYKFTFLYYNWSGTVRVPAVCQYAHKLAFLVGQSVHNRPSNALERQLYFL